jgi:hypothetical protein
LDREGNEETMNTYADNRFARLTRLWAEMEEIQHRMRVRMLDPKTPIHERMALMATLVLVDAGQLATLQNQIPLNLAAVAADVSLTPPPIVDLSGSIASLQTAANADTASAAALTNAATPTPPAPAVTPAPVAPVA